MSEDASGDGFGAAYEMGSSVDPAHRTTILPDLYRISTGISVGFLVLATVIVFFMQLG